ncbi:hypothetical protein K504DRAFT_70611 [Pleomassaria siparia CBS 279.74]|uniref:Uncharacterized protein n=1 Tax=Pleomassaria siparia CBS 279.74 TaxID=1314801 RepID=A0A6G1K226_9PLEO|nr:hypothetical protein K504DRAFT_70611 [Pleomassaria siparia CBS 279.74]
MGVPLRWVLPRPFIVVRQAVCHSCNAKKTKRFCDFRSFCRPMYVVMYTCFGLFGVWTEQDYWPRECSRRGCISESKGFLSHRHASAGPYSSQSALVRTRRRQSSSIQASVAKSSGTVAVDYCIHVCTGHEGKPCYGLEWDINER